MVTLCAHDALTGVDHHLSTVEAPTGAVLIVDSVVAFRPEYNDHWGYRIWLDIVPGRSLVRGVNRDEAIEEHDEASRVHHDRYHVALSIDISEVDPIAKADVIIDNSDFAHPRVRAAREGQAKP